MITAEAGAGLREAPSTLSVSVVDTKDEFARIEADWRRLFAQCARPVPFLTWEWVTTWWRHFGGASRMFVLVARDENDHVVGIAPLQIATRRAFGLATVRSMEFLGYRGSSVCPDHLDFLVDGGASVPVREALAKAIFAHHEAWDRMELADVSEDSPITEMVNRHAAEADLPTEQGPSQVCPYVPLPPTWDALLKAAKEKRRSLIKWRRKKLLQTYNVRFECLSAPESVHPAIDTLARLHTLSRQRKGESGNFHLPEYLKFHHEVAEVMARAGYLYFAQLDCNGQPAACSYGFHVGSVLYDYQKGFDPAFSRDGAGSVLTGMMIEDGIERLHAQEVDFLRGTEEYKYFWTSRDRKTRSILVWSRNVKGNLSRREFALRQRVSAQRKWAVDIWARVSSRYRGSGAKRQMRKSEEK